ncbi:MAG: recombinase family protein [Sphingobacteriaceae bacterium]|nr:recombinase family protein [Sphingobacteriaceae bacterium]
MTKVAIYSRVSSEQADYVRQTDELRAFAVKMGYELIATFQEKISGFKKNNERPQLMKLLALIDAGEVDKVLVWEMSRLGRNVIQVLETIELLNNKGVSLYIKNYNLETLDDNKKANPLSMFMIQILTSCSQMERDLIKSRLVSGYKNHRDKGGRVGRIKGIRETEKDFLAKHQDVVKLLKKGISVRNISKLTGDKSSATIIKVKKLMS